MLHRSNLFQVDFYLCEWCEIFESLWGDNALSAKSNILLGLVLIMILINNINASNTQGLEWAIAEGDQFNYSLRFNQTEPKTEGIWSLYVEVEELSAIPSYVTPTDIVIRSRYLTYWSNGTLFDHHFFWTAVPTGNWSLITEIIDNSPAGPYTVSDSSTEFVYSRQVSYDSQNLSSETRISKTDGVMNYYKTETVNNEGELLNMVEAVRESLPQIIPGLDNNLLIIGMVGVGALMVLVVLKRRR